MTEWLLLRSEIVPGCAGAPWQCWFILHFDFGNLLLCQVSFGIYSHRDILAVALAVPKARYHGIADGLLQTHYRSNR